MTIATPTQPTFDWSPEFLKARLDDRADFFILNVRNRDEYSAGRVEGPATPGTHNVPYFEVLEEGGSVDLLESVRNYARARLHGLLPHGKTILAVCAKGGTSAIVAEGLRSLGYEAVNLAGGMRAWAAWIEDREVPNTGPVRIWQLSRPARGCLSWVVARGTVAAVIDPLRHATHYREFAGRNGLRIRLVLDTHAHADHLSGGPELASASDAPYFLHPYDAIHPMDVLPAAVAYEPLRGGQVLHLGGSRLEVLHVPGHTLGNCAFLLDRRFLFAGDSIFIGSVARPDLGGHAETWTPLHYRSLRTLLELPDDVLVLPAHAAGPAEARPDGLFAATLGSLRGSNEGLVRAAGPEDGFRNWILASLPVFPPQYVDIKRANLGLIAPDEERAEELELGRNVCALESRPTRKENPS
jgi:glyoxylase-like metal-dependent hydrolase (beta-lactamase superfamily II)/rhodanese-related sulfurtransferase